MPMARRQKKNNLWICDNNSKSTESIIQKFLINILQNHIWVSFKVINCDGKREREREIFLWKFSTSYRVKISNKKVGSNIQALFVLWSLAHQHALDQKAKQETIK